MAAVSRNMSTRSPVRLVRNSSAVNAMSKPNPSGEAGARSMVFFR
jgi:hypothetical protein